VARSPSPQICRASGFKTSHCRYDAPCFFDVPLSSSKFCPTIGQRNCRSLTVNPPFGPGYSFAYYSGSVPLPRKPEPPLICSLSLPTRFLPLFPAFGSRAPARPPLICSFVFFASSPRCSLAAVPSCFASPDVFCVGFRGFWRIPSPLFSPPRMLTRGFLVGSYTFLASFFSSLLMNLIQLPGFYRILPHLQFPPLLTAPLFAPHL